MKFKIKDVTPPKEYSKRKDKRFAWFPVLVCVSVRVGDNIYERGNVIHNVKDYERWIWLQPYTVIQTYYDNYGWSDSELSEPRLFPDIEAGLDYKPRQRFIKLIKFI